jgi:NAD(P)H-quinone oxidoreductase subunit N
MALIITGWQFIREFEKSGALGFYMPPEGGFEGRYQRRLRAAGYSTFSLTARGLGDLSMYLTEIHGVRPAHLGKKSGEAAVGYRYYALPIVQQYLEQLPSWSKGLALWIIEGHVLSNQELQYLCDLTQQDSRVKLVVELGGERYCRWKPLREAVLAA